MEPVYLLLFQFLCIVPICEARQSFDQEPSFAFQGQGLFHTAAREGQHEAIKLLIEWQIPGLDTRFTDWASFFHL